MARGSLGFPLFALAATGTLLAACLLPSFDDVLPQAGADSGSKDSGAEVTPDAPLGDGGLVGCDDPSVLVNWPMTEGSGTTLRDCSGKYSGTFGPNVSWTTGRNGLAAIQTTGGFITIVDDPALRIVGPFTVATWIEASSSQMESFGDIIARYQSINVAAWDLTVTKDPQVALTLFAGSITQASAPLTYSKFTHVVGVYDSGSASIFVNGNVIQSGPGPTALPPVAVPITIGANAAGTSAYYGKIAGIRIYGRVLTTGEIKALAAK